MTDKTDTLQAIWQAIHLYKLESGETVGQIIRKGNDKINLCNLVLDAAWNTRPQPPAPQDGQPLQKLKEFDAAPQDDLVKAVRLGIALNWQDTDAAARAVIPIAQAPIIAERDALRAKLAEMESAYKDAAEGWDSASSSLSAAQVKLAAAEALLKPQWFYADGYDQEGCCDSPEEVIEYLDLKPGDNVVQVDCAGPLPSLWYVVHIRTDEEMDALETDDREVITQYPSEEAAREALATEKQP